MGIDKKDLDVAPSAVSNIRKLERGRIDLFAYDENVSKWIIKQEGFNPEDYDKILNKSLKLYVIHSALICSGLTDFYLLKY